MPSKKQEIINKELIKIQAESKRRARRAFDIDRAAEQVDDHIEELYQTARERTRIEFELAEMSMLLDQHVGTRDEVLITGLMRDLAQARYEYDRYGIKDNS